MLYNYPYMATVGVKGLKQAKKMHSGNRNHQIGQPSGWELTH